MSELVVIEIVSSRDCSLDVEVTIVHPDEQRIYTDAGFAMRILLEQFRAIEEGRIQNGSGNFYPFDKEGGESLISEKLRSLLEPLSIVCHSREGTAYREQAESLIRSVECISHKNYPRTRDQLETWLEHQGKQEEGESRSAPHQADPNPSYVLRIEVADNALLAHMRPGSRWGSAAYGGDYSENVPRPRILLEPAPLENLVSSLELREWWSRLTEAWQGLLTANLCLQRECLFSDLTDDRANVLGCTLESVVTRYQIDTSVELSDKDLLELCQLKALFASRAPISSLGPLARLQGLRLVELEGTSIGDLAPLVGLKHLAYLNIYSCRQLTDLAPLAELNGLMHLYCDPKEQRDIDAIGKLRHLRTLHMMSNFDIDASPLAGLESIREITAGSGEIAESSLRVLRELKRRGANIEWLVGGDETAAPL